MYKGFQREILRRNFLVFWHLEEGDFASMDSRYVVGLQKVECIAIEFRFLGNIQ